CWPTPMCSTPTAGPATWRRSVSADQAALARPGIVHVTASLNGPHGPWAGRVGFDQTAGSLVGMMNLEGDAAGPALPPILAVNDYIVSWLMAAGAAEALARRAVEGGSYRVHVSLTRVALTEQVSSGRSTDMGPLRRPIRASLTR